MRLQLLREEWMRALTTLALDVAGTVASRAQAHRIQQDELQEIMANLSESLLDMSRVSCVSV